MPSRDYSQNVFINCPFDDEYQPIFHAIVFAIYDCGYIARCALEQDNGGISRFEKIYRIILECKFGIHDISRTELDDINGLPRFNMPLEFGVFLGARKYGGNLQKAKSCLILDREKYRYQKFISDIAGQDIRAHQNDLGKTVKHVRNWLNNASNATIPSGDRIFNRYNSFKENLPVLCDALMLNRNEIEFNDYVVLVSQWLKANNW